MTIYLVFASTYDETEILGAYASREVAERRMEWESRLKVPFRSVLMKELDLDETLPL